MIPFNENSIECGLIQRIQDEKLIVSLSKIREAVNLIWAADSPRIIRAFTGHDLEHCQRILCWCAQILEGFELNNKEMYALLAAAYLHDIGMQCDVAKQSGIKSAAKKLGANFPHKFTAMTADKYSSEEQEMIRKNHHYLSAGWIDYDYRMKKTVLADAVRTIPSDLVSDVIDICLYHSSLSIMSCPTEFKHLPGNRKRLVAAILRLADELDIDKSRASVDTIRDISLDPDNALYWWLHERTNIQFINPHLLLINVRLHPDDARKYGESLKKIVVDNFQKKNNEVFEVLAQAGISILVSTQSGVTENPYESKLPSDVVEALTCLAEGQTCDAGVSSQSAITLINAPATAHSDQIEMGNLLSGLTIKLSEDSNIDPSIILRVYLLSAAYVYNAQTGSVLGNHEINMLYQHRCDAELSKLESYLVLRTMVADKQDCAVGWRFLNSLDVDDLYHWISQAVLNDNGSSVRAGALKFILRFSRNSTLQTLRNALNDGDSNVRMIAADLLAHHGDMRDIELIEGKVADESLTAENGQKYKLILLSRLDPKAAIQSLDSSCESIAKDSLAATDLSAFSNEELILILSSTCQAARLACAKELYRRKSCLDKLAELIEEKNIYLGEIALRARIIMDPEMTSADLDKQIKSILPSDKGNTSPFSLMSKPKIDEQGVRVLYWSNAAPDLLEEQLVWGLDNMLVSRLDDAEAAYTVLVTQHFEYIRYSLYSDLETRFERIRQASFARIADEKARGEAERQKLLDELNTAYAGASDNYIRSIFTKVALEGIAKNGGSEFAPIVRTIVQENDLMTKDAAIKALAVVGDGSDVLMLLDYASKWYRDGASIAAKAALRLTDNLPETARQLIGFGRDEPIKLSLGALAESYPNEAIVECKKLLSHENGTIRKIAVAYLSYLLNATQLANILDALILEKHYYYNVICWIDRLLYAPEPICANYRNELYAECDMASSPS